MFFLYNNEGTLFSLESERKKYMESLQAALKDVWIFSNDF